MRDYSKASSRFWTGDTGKKIRALGRAHTIIGFYLFTAPGSNMLGLYYLPLVTLAHETSIPVEEARKVLGSLSEGGYAHYDEHSEHVWVVEMAKHQIGERLSKKDNRHKAVTKQLEQLRKIPFFNDFLRRYLEDFELQDVPFDKTNRSPLQAPSKPGAGAGAGAEERTRSGSFSLSETPERAERTEANLDPDRDPQNHAAWLEVRAAYPPHIHPEADWLIAERDASMRVGEGDATWSELKAGCERLHRQQIAKGNVAGESANEYVPSPKSMFTRREKRWREPYPLPAKKADQRLASNLSAAEEFMRRTETGT